MTKTLYLTDCYLREFEATITAANGKEIELDQTAFYPNSGGQPNDTGIITSADQDYIVSDVTKNKGRIVHIVDREGLREGDKITAQIDWTRRYSHMKYHTASHILSGVISKLTGADITGNQIAIEKTRIDFDLQEFDKANLNRYEEETNRVMKQGYPVTIKFVPREEAAKIPRVTKLAMGLPDSIKEVRIVSVEGFEQEACGGTHLRNTSEAGEIEIIGAENKGKSNRRIYFRLKE